MIKQINFLLTNQAQIRRYFGIHHESIEYIDNCKKQDKKVKLLISLFVSEKKNYVEYILSDFEEFNNMPSENDDFDGVLKFLKEEFNFEVA